MSNNPITSDASPARRVTATVVAMKMIRRLLTSRFGRLGLLSDLAMVFTAARKIAGNSKAGSAQLNGGSRSARMGPGEWALVAGAAFRLINRARNRRSAKTAR